VTRPWILIGQFFRCHSATDALGKRSSGEPAERTACRRRRSGELLAVGFDLPRIGLAREHVQRSEKHDARLQNQGIDQPENTRDDADFHGDRAERKGQWRGSSQRYQCNNGHCGGNQPDDTGDDVHDVDDEVENLRNRRDAVGQRLVRIGALTKIRDGLAGVMPVARRQSIDGHSATQDRSQARNGDEV
jgi:hypothetical protein